MAYDEDLAHRVREQLAGELGAITERKMFGGIAFLLHGNTAVGVMREDLMVRVGADEADAALAEPHTRVLDMTRRPMKNWILVAPEGISTNEKLAAWMRRGLRFAGSLPPKG